MTMIENCAGGFGHLTTYPEFLSGGLDLLIKCVAPSRRTYAIALEKMDGVSSDPKTTCAADLMIGGSPGGLWSRACLKCASICHLALDI